MSTPLNLNIDPEMVQEIPMVDLAFMILKAANTPYYYRDLMNEVAKLRRMSEEQINEAIAQLYTEINIDGRFACVGTNLWGLKRWYPVDRSEDPVASSKRPRIINDDDDDLEDEDFVEEEDGYISDEDEDYEALDEDGEDELFQDDEEEEVDEVDDDNMLNDEEMEEEEALADEEDELDSEDDYDDNDDDKDDDKDDD